MAKKRSRRKHTTDILVDATNPEITKLIQYPKEPDEPQLKAKLECKEKGLWMSFKLED